MTRSMTLGLYGLALGSLMAAGIAIAASPFDGTYAGPMKVTKNSNTGYCRATDRDQVRLVVADGVAKYTWGQEALAAPVQPDGSFLGSAPGWNRGLPFELRGKITGGNLEADVGNNSCGAHLSLKKS